MQRYIDDTFAFDFGDDDSGIWWTASVTVDTDYDSVLSFRVTVVHVGGKSVAWDAVDSDLQQRIRERMGAVEMADFIP